MSRFFLGLTGASGHPYAEGVIRALVAAGQDVDLAVTEAGAKVLRHELGVGVDADDAVTSPVDVVVALRVRREDRL